MRKITIRELRSLRGREGLILAGCDGNLSEWADGVNEWLTEDGILKNGTKFEDISAFSVGNTVCVLFMLTDNVELDIGKLTDWRMRNQTCFGSTWLSDFQNNQLHMEDRFAEDFAELQTGTAKERDMKEGSEPC